MKPFMDEDFLLETKSARELYHSFASEVPIIDYHCHLNPEDIANDRKFNNISEIWLAGDHYKWRAMRANGINEKYCTGDAPDRDKFMKWAETVPATLRNPLYHWTHMELRRYFGIQELLGLDTAEMIYDKTAKMLQEDEFSVRNLLRKMNVEVVCTTDDPVDSLEHHRKISEDGFEIKVLPTWRPDKAMAVDDIATYISYLDQLAEAASHPVNHFMDLLEALMKRHDYFGSMGCRLSDHGLEHFIYEEYTHEEIEEIFAKIRTKKEITQTEKTKFRTAMLVELAVMDHDKGWTQQFHVGAIRNNNSRMFHQVGPDSGFDSIGDFPMARAMSRFFARLDHLGQLAKTIVYNLNPSDNEVMVTMACNFNDGTVPGKMQFGSGWWFLDQKKGMEAQLDSLSQLGLLSRFIGMLTDSRSFLSFPRHEYFRRILCNLLGRDMENGELPNDMEMVGTMVHDICYRNAKQYFGF
ncbi:MAG: glucuronate isomerase [Bacteroidales bacterium]|nr:glucuronate isomerase [Bacteroidales bacterium]MDT8432473.1 glucuronate isomerase [Bacteroidales bacterium]